ncbi:hypothetical protein D3C87_1925700 [compost metagenome]
MRMIKMAITASVLLFATSGFAAWKQLSCGRMVQTATVANGKGSYTKQMKLASAKTTTTNPAPTSAVGGQF